MVFVGQNMFLDEADVTALLNFVEQGNNAFIASKWIPEDLSYHFFGPDCYYYTNDGYYNDVETFYEDTISLYLENPRLLPSNPAELSFVYRFEPTNHPWNYVDSARICDPEYGVEVLGTLDSGRNNFLRLEWGNGYFYLHTNPELFTNYFLADSSRYDYPRAVFSYLTPGTVYWDEYSRTYRPPPRQNNRTPYNPNGGRELLSDNHALRYILDQPALAFAWFLLLISAFLYIVFRGKRRQRIIPVRPPKENTSKQFVDTIARLTQQHGDHARLAKREIKVLRHHLNERFQLRWREGHPPPDDLALRTGLAAENVDHALAQIKFVEQRQYMEEGDLMRFYRAVQPFYEL
ncbi:MAG: DUF4350 domain-containing protein [Bacteroidota bacterium]